MFTWNRLMLLSLSDSKEKIDHSIGKSIPNPDALISNGPVGPVATKNTLMCSINQAHGL